MKSEQVDNTVRQQAWPRDKFHPLYESFTAWLDAEAPVTEDTRNQSDHRYRPAGRGNTRD